MTHASLTEDLLDDEQPGWDADEDALLPITINTTHPPAPTRGEETPKP